MRDALQIGGSLGVLGWVLLQALEYLLVHCGANPNSTDATNGASLLHWASQRGNSTVVQLLIQNEAEVDKMVRKTLTLYPYMLLTPQDWKGNTPLFEACKNGHVYIADILVKQYVIFLLCLVKSHSYLLYSGANVNAMCVSKRTPLHEAAQFGHYETAKLLLDHKANLDTRENVNNNTPAELASLHKHHKVSEYKYHYFMLMMQNAECCSNWPTCYHVYLIKHHGVY